MIIEILLLLLLLLFWAYYEVTKQFDYFKKKCVPFAKPSFPFGSQNMKKVVLQQNTFNKDVSELADNEFKGVKIFGYFAFGQPTWVINDEELAKQILIKDFDHFVDRRALQDDFSTKANAIVSSFLTNLKGDKWKAMRTLMSGVFTSGKLKLMAPHMVKVGQQLEEYIGQIIAGTKKCEGVVAEDGSVEMKALFGLYTLDAIASTGFGIEINSFEDPNNIFRDMSLTLIGSKKTWKSKLVMMRILLNLVFPRLAKMLGISFFPQGPVDFFTAIIERTYQHRKNTGERRNDIIDLIVDEMNMAKTAKKAAEEFESDFEKDAALGATNASNDAVDKEVLLVSNALLFFFAGFDTTSTGLSMIVHNLAKHQDVQDRLTDEINSVLGDSDKVDFETLQQLKYMDMVISECFRHQDFLASLERRCTKAYTIPGTDFTIEEGRYVKIYQTDISRDEKNFKNPTVFDPENFAPENAPNKFGLLMFGQGPRNCIGMRYALLAIKAALVFLLRKYRLVPSAKTTDEIELSTSNPGKFEVWLKPELRN